MADKKSETLSFETIESLKIRQGISDAVYEGILAANSWRAGKQVTLKEFEKAHTDFLASPIYGKRMGGNK